MDALMHGVILAFGLILPLGVQNVFIFNQGATHKKLVGAFPAILTAGICDTILIYLAVAGVSLIVLNQEWLRSIIFIVGSIFLVYIGWLMWKSKPEMENKELMHSFTVKRQIAFAASVSLLNPHAIMDTVGVIGTNALVYSGADKWIFTLTCIVVSWLWFFALAISGKKIGQIAGNGNLLKRINQVSAIIIWFVAIYIGLQFF